MSHIKMVNPKDHYRLEIHIDNGNMVILNFENRIQTMRFGALADPELFRQAATDGHYIRWGRKVEISIDEVFQLAQK